MNGLSFENLPASPESIFQQEYKSGQRQIQQQFKLQWDEINRRAKSFGSPAKHKQALDDLYTKGQQTMFRFNQEMQQRSDQLKQVDQLAEQGAIQNPDEVKWRMTLGPEAEAGMFPRQADPRTEFHANLRLRESLMDNIAAYQLDSKGNLYHSELDEKGFYTEKIDKSRPANETERYDWEQSIGALETAKVYSREQIIPKLTRPEFISGRLQEMMLEKREESWLKKLAKTYFGITAPGLIYRGYKRLTKEAPGTFPDKVSQTIKRPTAKPRIKEPEQRKLTKEIAIKYLNQYGGDVQQAMAAAELAGYVE